MALPRFFAEHLPAGGTFHLDDEEARHASGVLRLASGDACIAFDGKGGEARCVVRQISKRNAELEVIERPDTDRELPKRIVLITALPKGDRQKSLVDSLVQLGVHALQPLVTHRSVAEPADAALARLRRSVIESSKQCGRNRLMEILNPVTVDDLSKSASVPSVLPRSGPIDAVTGVSSGQSDDALPACLRLVAHPYGTSQHISDYRDQLMAAHCIEAVVGPEGGLTDEEVQSLCAAQWRAVSLGSRILRVEVAAAHLASCVAMGVSQH